MGNRFRAEIPSRYVTSYPGQLSLAMPLRVGAVSTTESCEGVNKTHRAISVSNWSDIYLAAVCNATHGIAKAFLSVCLSVRLSNACTVTKENKLMPSFLYHMKERLS